MVLFNVNSIAQPRFEIPGQFALDIYTTQFYESSEELSLRLWGSRGVNLYYLQEINLINDKLTLNPGIGIASEKLSFQDDITLQVSVLNENRLSLQALSPEWDVRKSILAAEYLDVPVELRFQTAKGYRAFRFAVGFRVGWLFRGRTKIKYETLDEELVKLKEQNQYLLNQWRYGIIARIGLGKVNFFGAYNFNTMFQKDALQEIASNYNPQSFSVGITFFTF